MRLYLALSRFVKRFLSPPKLLDLASFLLAGLADVVGNALGMGSLGGK